MENIYHYRIRKNSRVMEKNGRLYIKIDKNFRFFIPLPLLNPKLVHKRGQMSLYGKDRFTLTFGEESKEIKPQDNRYTIPVIVQRVMKLKGEEIFALERNDYGNVFTLTLCRNGIEGIIDE